MPSITSNQTICLPCIAAVLVLSCGNNGDTGGLEGPPVSHIPTTNSGQGALTVRMIDAPLDVDNVWVTINELSVKSCAGGWTDIMTEAQTVDLLALQGGVFASLAEASLVPTGDYCEFRLVVDDSATVTVDGESESLKIPSGSSSGIKFKGEFSVVPNVNTIVTFDFDAEKSVHQQGNGKYSMRPVISLASTAYVSPDGYSIPGANPTGFVTFKVGPETAGIVQLPGAGELEFEEGSVETEIEITATLWTPILNDARSGTYVFGPSTQFLKPPKLTIPTTTGSEPTLFLDYKDLSTTAEMTQDGYLASAPIAHFSCAAATTRFSGLPTDDWYSDPIVALDMNGAFDRSEFGNSYFAPGDIHAPVKREEMVAMIARAVFSVEAEFLPELAAAPFADVSKDHKFAKYIYYMKNFAKVIDGCGNGVKFCLGENLNRAELAKIVVDTLQNSGRNKDAVALAEAYLGLAGTMWNGVFGREYDDVKWDMCGPGCAWYYGHVYAAWYLGIMSGDAKTNTFRPEDPVSRAEAAKVACFLAYGKGECGACNTIAYDASYAIEYAMSMYAMENYDNINQFANYEGDPEFAEFKAYNCTNFVSQSLLAGLLRTSDPSEVFARRGEFADAGGDYEWFYNSKGDKGPAWAGADKIREYAFYNVPEYTGMHFDPVTTIRGTDWKSEHMKIREGDIVFADLEPDGDDKLDNNWEHSVIVTQILKDVETPDRVLVTQQSTYKLNRRLDELASAVSVFEVYRPTFFRKDGL